MTRNRSSRPARGCVELGPIGLLVALVAAASWCSRANAHADLDSVKEQVEAHARERPDDPSRQLERALVYRAAHDWDAAIAAYERARDLGADRDEIDAAEAGTYLEAGWPRTAIVQFDRVLARRPEAAGALFGRGQALLQIGELDRAAADLGRAIEILPQPKPEQVFLHRDVLVSLGRRDDAIRALDAGIGRLGPAVSLELAALDLEEQGGHHDAALRRIDRLLATEPRNEIWIARRGDILEKMGRSADARAEYTRALRLLQERPAGRRGADREALAARLGSALAAPRTPGLTVNDSPTKGPP